MEFIKHNMDRDILKQKLLDLRSSWTEIIGPAMQYIKKPIHLAAAAAGNLVVVLMKGLHRYDAIKENGVLGV